MKTLPHIGTLLAGFVAASLQADLLIYEGWDYALPDYTVISGTSITATGLTGNYSNDFSGGTARYRTAGLSFGTNYLPTTGGSLYQSASGSGSYTVLRASTNFGGHTGNLWSSYLVQFEAFSTEGAQYIRARNGSDRKFISAVDVTGADSLPGVGYDSGVTTTSDSGSLSAGTTYLALSSFTNVGNAGGGTAKQYIFTLSGYDAWLSAGASEAGLASHAIFYTEDTATNAEYLSNEINFVLGGSGTGTESAFIDEVRYGTTLSDVIAVPEPSSFLLMAGGMLLVTLGTLKSRRSSFKL
ncbi:PEP-CTERM sorting domain-containing protein [Kiritimatiellaeota bacterium B1221]|nr:PEP-CTERM sorting domain-containing protein [Kiritimatiellaeota bacterium B1221]